jgi:hypothetical protein
MQDDAFAWLDRQFGMRDRSGGSAERR